MPDQQMTGWSAKVETAYLSHSRELWALLYAQCCDADRAHDAVQEAFTRLQEQNGAPIRDVRAWLLQVGRNWLRDVARRRKVAARSTSGLDELPGEHDDPSRVLARAELQSCVREALKQLRHEDREVLVLRYSLGWASSRIAAVLGSSASAVDMRLSRARRRLAEILEEAGVNGNE